MENTILCLHLDLPAEATIEYKRMIRSIITHSVRDVLEDAGSPVKTELTKTNWTNEGKIK